jgi:hypothetical protein
VTDIPLLSLPSAGWAVLCQIERFDNVSQRFSSGGPDITAWHGVVLIILLLIVAGALWKIARLGALRDGRSYFNARQLFAQLCRHHQLDWSSRRLLRRLARSRQLKHPAQVFLEPLWFDTANMPPGLRPYRQQLVALRERIFAPDHPGSSSEV